MRKRELITALADNPVYVAGLFQPVEQIKASLPPRHEAHTDALDVVLEILDRYYKEHFKQ